MYILVTRKKIFLFYVHIGNKKKDIFILGEDPTQGLDDTTLNAEKKYLINFTEHNKEFCLRLHAL